MALLQLLVLLLAMSTQQVKADQQENRTFLHLLNVLPFPDSGDEAYGEDSAYELIPAAQLAVDQINNASHILPGYKLTLVNVEAEACSATFVTDGIINTYAKLFTPGNSLNVVGFTGLICSIVTDTITLIYGVPKMTYLQFAGSITPLHRDSIKFPWLVHFRSSTATFNDAMVEMMKKFNWATANVVVQYGSLFYESLAEDLSKRARDTHEFNVTAIIGNTRSIFFELNSRIVYISASNKPTVELMCKAYRSSALYPRFVYILPEITVPGLLSQANTTDCSRKELKEAVEGVFTVTYKLSNEGDHKLVSNMTYQEYRHQYLQYLMEMEFTINATLSKENIFANVMYDQIWAFALTLKKSLVNLQAANISFEKLKLHQTKQFASILRSKLENLSFEGASGFLHLNADGDETSLVEIFQVIDGVNELVGTYDPDADEKLSLLRELSLPPDTFEIRTIHLPLWVSTFFSIYVIFWIFMTTFVVIFIRASKRRPEVKASSPSLILVMIIGCYLLFATTLVRNVTMGYLIADNIFTLLCNFEAWFGVIGLTLIFSALLIRLLRVSRIFEAYGKLSQFWKDKYMILSICAVCFGEIILLILWTAIDKVHIVSTTTFQSHATSHFFERKSVCNNGALGLWLGLTLSYNGALMFVIVIIAVRTRKIRLSNFKKTKQINIFIMLTCTTLGIFVPLSLLPAFKNTVLGHFIVCFAISSTAVYCQFFIFLPQVFNTVLKMKAEKKSATSQPRIRESQFSRAARYIRRASTQPRKAVISTSTEKLT